MESIHSRTELLIGEEGVKRLKNSRVLLFGVGGVGGYCAEALVRAGVGELGLVDPAQVTVSNLNRQLYALRSTVGRDKVDVAKERIADIDPSCTVTTHKTFVLPETVGAFDFSHYDYVVDAIDTVAGKLAIAERAAAENIPLISAMGAGNKFDPALFEVADIAKTSVCPLARTMRRELKKRGIEHLKVVYSKEPPVRPLPPEEENDKEKEGKGKPVPASISFVPPVVGFLLAGEVIKDLLQS